MAEKHLRHARSHLYEHGSIGAKIADKVASGMGSWRYIIIQSVIVVFWIALNTAGWFVWKWDLPPFILLNLIFSTQASYAAPVIMMSQNRQSTLDHKRDDLEASEISSMFENHELLLNINKQQLEILQTMHTLIETRKAQKKSPV